VERSAATRLGLGDPVTASADLEGVVLESVVDAIGNTPLIELKRLTAGTGGRIFAKLEHLNPGSSKKDRVARRILDDAARTGELRPGQTVVELTSGNTGIGASIVCAVRGHPFVAVMSRGNSAERRRMMLALGAEVVLVDQTPGGRVGQVSGADLALVEERTRQLVQERGAFRIDQFVRPSNADAYEHGLAAELPPAFCRGLTAFCDTVGSGGSLAGLTRALRAVHPRIRTYAVEPAAAAVLADPAATAAPHALQGAGYGMRDLALLKGAAPAGFVAISDTEAISMARQLARQEGVFGGVTAGANVAAALKLLAGPEANGAILVLICDSGLKYLSGDLWP
jgi:cysteine synthase A